jgi:shikimate dehydrogenase
MERPYAEVIGDPIGHSKSPAIHGFWLGKLGLDADYRAVHVLSESLADYFAERRQDAAWRGCNVTVPHKQAVIPFVDELSPLAGEVGAVNLITPQGSRLAADNSDVLGIINSLPPDLLAKPPIRMCLIGSGGAARAALAAFNRLPVGEVGLNVRDRAKGEGLLEEFSIAGRCGPVDDEQNIVGADLLVNATTLGMAGQTAMPDGVLRHVTAMGSGAVVFDMVYSPLDTELLLVARRSGLATVDGLAMLIEQAAAAFERFFGTPPPRAHDDALRALLTS